MTWRRTPLPDGASAGLLSGGQIHCQEGEYQQRRQPRSSGPLRLSQKLLGIGKRESIVRKRTSLVRSARLERDGGCRSFLRAAKEKGRSRGK